MNNLKNIRKKAGFMQYSVADKLKVSTKTMQRWESGQTLPNAIQLNKLADIYDCTPTDLLIREGE